MRIVKSKGVTATETLLANLCERSFLKLWSYPNVFKDDRDELCDLLAVFENHVFIFFDRDSQVLSKKDKDPLVNWNRWRKKVIDDQTRTAHGAERYIRSGRGIFLDNNLQVPLPIHINRENIIIHKIIVAHGAKQACEEFSDNNVFGSLGIIYGDIDGPFPFPFIINIDRNNPVHIFDSHNLPIIFHELDTFWDLSSYLDKKCEAIKSCQSLVYCGEEDLLAHYFFNVDDSSGEHFIGTPSKEFDHLVIAEGEWDHFTKQDFYLNKKLEDEISYAWDELIQQTCQNTLDGTLLGDDSPLRGESAIHEMAKEPRFFRRMLSQNIIRVIRDFPESQDAVTRSLSFFPSFYEGTGYVFLQLKIAGTGSYNNEHRKKRQGLLQIACGAAKNKFPHLQKVVGIAIDAPKYSRGNSEDFILLNCASWSDDDRKQYEELNKEVNFFNTTNLKEHRVRLAEFPNTKLSLEEKAGRNDPCPCGSGRKYKKCCMR